MTIDTEGSELEIVQDFPWNDFDIRVVMIEQLNARRYPAQAGQKQKIMQHMQSVGYKLLSVYVVADGDTDDLIFTRNIDEFVAMTTHAMDGGDKGTSQTNDFLYLLHERGSFRLGCRSLFHESLHRLASPPLTFHFRRLLSCLSPNTF
jgi:hypothetical protein